MKIVKVATTILLVLLFVLAIASLLMGGFVPLFSIAFGFLLIYYVLVYGIIFLAHKTGKAILRYLALLLFFLPVVWGLWDLESLFNFLLQGIHLDMK
ncbi:hypothetical protein [Flagellimonas meridianipacifica]|uniref:Uncharacterized protein n=1 Tax=Flagellimonas meridianipacifica TaxID=1080225 RepID=A0A2T0MH95_9FLAO|nr:hypothetical protein [Allomuricauda pacifica]PRX56947.1 hypothetical protein CLV81_0948 [Allomuricauda pacifica]